MSATACTPAVPMNPAARIAELEAELAKERRAYAGLAQECEEMVLRLERLADHLRSGIMQEVLGKLADYADGVGYEHRSAPPLDPYPHAGGRSG